MSNEERALRQRIRFLLPPIVAIGFILGLGIMESDFVAVHEVRGVLCVLFWQLALVGNIVIRRRYQVQLDRLLEGRCTACGYDLRATPERCPECGETPK